MSELQRLQDALDLVNEVEKQDPVPYPYLYGYLHSTIEGFLRYHREDSNG